MSGLMRLGGDCFEYDPEEKTTEEKRKEDALKVCIRVGHSWRKYTTPNSINFKQDIFARLCLRCREYEASYEAPEWWDE